jgi:hypothetical protein
MGNMKLAVRGEDAHTCIKKYQSGKFLRRDIVLEAKIFKIPAVVSNRATKMHLPSMDFVGSF